MDKEEIQKYSGEEYYRKPSQLNVPNIRLHGNKGIFFKGQQGDDGEWAEEELGESIKGIILRVRRRLSFIGDDINMYTNEHNHPNEKISLFERSGQGSSHIQTATGRELREMEPRLRTQQILYMLLGDEQELVKLQVKGSSLGSRNKPEDSIPLYEFLSDFSKDEHVWEYNTEIISKEEEGKLGTYYAMSFEKGDKHKLLEKVGETIKYLHEVFETQKNYFEQQTETEESEQSESQEGKKSQERPEKVPEIDIDDLGEEEPDEINPKEVFGSDE